MTSTAPQPHANHLDAQALERLHELDPGGNNKLVERVIHAYLKSLERLVPELQQARVGTLDLNVVRHVSHTLKSSSASLGALDLSATCAEIELMARNGQTAEINWRLDVMLDQLARVKQALTMMLMTGQQ